ncbi:MAG: Hsp20/alpha crystallin family protein [Deltaproteobacteria bacterium]|nr:Hsp20/alpha crystallin family protein [Deltaproteobacteria bacterium]
MFALSIPRYGLSYRPLRSLFDIWSDYPASDFECEEWTPTSNVTETEKQYVITLEVPGIDMKKTEITYKEDILSVKGVKKSEIEEGEKSVCTERFAGSFSRDFRLAVKVDEDKIDATYKDGVLKIVLPKSESAIPRKIAIH